MEGKLYVCATPIGNLEDITQRVLQTLRAVDLIAAEDTRHTKKLLNHYGIHTPLISYHQHNERERSQEILQMLRDGKQIALVSDAGTPAISDPGQILVRRCRDEGLAVTALPGPCALITALSMSGLDSRRFVFEGFLPAGKRERAAVLERLVEETRSDVYYSSNVSMEKLIMEQLLEGPQTEGAKSAIPAGTKLINVSVVDGVCYVSLDENFKNQDYQVNEAVVIYSIVDSLTELSTISKVQISVNGDTSGTYRDNFKLSDMYDRNLDYVVSLEETGVTEEE